MPSKVTDLTPLNGYVLIQVLDEVEKMRGGLLLPETTSKDRGNIAVVLKNSYNDTDPLVPEGSKVMFAKYAGTVVQDKFSTDEFRLIRQTDILGIFHEG